MSRVVTLFAPRGGWFESGSMGYITLEEAQKAVDSNGFGDVTPIIAEVNYTLPEGAFWTGDNIIVELHRGGNYNESSIHSGGQWVEFCGVVKALIVNMELNEVTGALMDAKTGRPIQIMPLHAGLTGFPYRNARLLSD